jgi:hypothetical protein
MATKPVPTDRPGTVRPARLKRCPFCGGKAKLRETTNFEWVECSGCYVEMTRDPQRLDSPVTRWNRRSP